MSDPSDPEAHKDPRHFELLKSTMWLYEQGRYDFAVIGLQTALEVYLELTVVRLVKSREIGSLGDAIVDTLMRSYRFDDGRFQALWYGLTGDDFKKQETKRTQDWWKSYAAHTKLRDRVVHRGYMPTVHEDRALPRGHARRYAVRPVHRDSSGR